MATWPGDRRSCTAGKNCRRPVGTAQRLGYSRAQISARAGNSSEPCNVLILTRDVDTRLIRKPCRGEFVLRRRSNAPGYLHAAATAVSALLLAAGYPLQAADFEFERRRPHCGADRNELVTEYRFKEPRACLSPMMGPAGRHMAARPLVADPAHPESTDHPHHRGSGLPMAMCDWKATERRPISGIKTAWYIRALWTTIAMPQRMPW